MSILHDSAPPLYRATRYRAGYRLPVETRTWEDARRLRHLDLPSIPTALLARERAVVHRAIMESAAGDPWAGWLEDRLVALEDELAARRSIGPASHRQRADLAAAGDCAALADTRTARTGAPGRRGDRARL